MCYEYAAKEQRMKMRRVELSDILHYLKEQRVDHTQWKINQLIK